MRSTVLFLLLLFAAAVPARAWTMGDDGLHKEAWFSLTFRDVSDDIRQARESGKRLVLDFEQRGCIYCKKMHEQILSDPRVSDYIKANFMVVQYNMFGDEEVTDLDGKQLSEKTAARKWGLLFTPTLLFMPDHVPDKPETAAQAAVAVMPGAFGKATFLDMFRWVKQKGYDTDEPFQKFHARMLAERGHDPKAPSD